MNDADPYTVDCPACEAVVGSPCDRGKGAAAKIAGRIATLDAQATKWRGIAAAARATLDTDGYNVARKRAREIEAARDACGTDPHALRLVYANECARRRLATPAAPRRRPVPPA